MVRSEHSRSEIAALYVFGVYGSLILIKVRLVRVSERVGGYPVAESKRNLKFVGFRLVLYKRVSHAAQKRLEGRSGLRIQILAVVILFIGVLIVGIYNKIRIPFNAYNPPYKPGRHIGVVRSVCLTRGFGNFCLAVNYVYKVYRVSHEIVQYLFIFGVGIGQTLYILLVYPYALVKIQLVFRLFIEIPQRLVKLRRHKSINSYAVAVHFAYIAEPAVIGIVGDCKISREKPRLGCAYINAAHEHLLPVAAFVNVEIIALRLKAVAYAGLIIGIAFGAAGRRVLFFLFCVKGDSVYSEYFKKSGLSKADKHQKRCHNRNNNLFHCSTSFLLILPQVFLSFLYFKIPSKRKRVIICR